MFVCLATQEKNKKEYWYVYFVLYWLLHFCHEVLPILCVQKSFYLRLTQDKKSEVFFRIFFEYIRQALQEIKATGPVNTAETAAGKNSDEYKDAGKEENKKKGNWLTWLCLCFGKVPELQRFFHISLHSRVIIFFFPDFRVTVFFEIFI